MRGPFLPLYWPRSLHWSRAYIGLLTPRIKLVGGSIVCLQHPDGCIRRDPECLGPKVEGYVWATDRVGLKVLLRGFHCRAFGFRKIFAQHQEKSHAVLYGEYGMNRAILAANYSITTPLLAYRNVDWSDPSFTNNASKCNGFRAHSREGWYNGISIHPYESVFIKTSWYSQGTSLTWVGNSHVAPLRPREMPLYTKWELEGAARHVT